MKTPADNDKGKDRKRKKDDDAAPEVVVVSVSPPRPPPEAKPGADEVWVTLLESSPWSSKTPAQGERVPPVALRSTTPAGSDSVSRWSEPVWRTPVRTEAPETTIEEPVATTDVETAAIDPRAAVTSLADLVRSSEPLLSRARVEEEPPVAEPVAELAVPPQPIFAPEAPEVLEPVGAVAPEVEVYVRVDAVEMAPAAEEPVAVEAEVAVEPDAIAEPETFVEPEPVVEPEPEPEVAVEPDVVAEPEAVIEPEPEPEPVVAAPAEAAKPEPASQRYEVPVEDLVGGIFGLAGSAVRGAASAAAGLVGGLVKGGRKVGSGLAAGTRRLTGGAGGCQGCSDTDCGSDTKK
ncbi:MAG TPA: hypothetical protein HPQ04_11820 [Rhodospirillaceae bacterium]|nr:hypothetical protein [Rhodospirillaceae bacterium]